MYQPHKEDQTKTTVSKAVPEECASLLYSFCISPVLLVPIGRVSESVLAGEF